jgi:hypothetical protein
MAKARRLIPQQECHRQSQKYVLPQDGYTNHKEERGDRVMCGHLLFFCSFLYYDMVLLFFLLFLLRLLLLFLL